MWSTKCAGTIWIAADEGEMIEARRKRDYYVARGVPAQVLSSQDLRRLEPNLREGLVGGLLVPEDSVLYPPCAARFLIKRAQNSGAELRLGCSVVKSEKGKFGWLTVP